MQWLILVLCCFINGIIIYQDLKNREVTWIVFPALVVAAIFFNLSYSQSFGSLFANMAINICFIGLQFFLLWVYFYWRKQKASLYNKIGLGDILFLLACCFFFSPLNFLFFYMLSLLFSLGIFLIFFNTITKRKTVSSVPLAGLQAIFLQVFMIVNVLLANNLTTDDWLLNKIL